MQHSLADDVADYGQKNLETPSGAAYQGMEISKVPAVIATKSSRATMKTMRKVSSRQPLTNSNSFLTNSNNAKAVQRSQLRKLASFNDDLKDVVKRNEYKAS